MQNTLPSRNLARLVITAMIVIQLGTVASHWSDIIALRPDFAALYGSAQQFRTGGDSAVPGGSAQEGNQQPTSKGMAADTLHPPFEMLLFLPLSFLEYRVAYVFWAICNVAMLWVVPFLLWEELGALQREFHFVAIVYGSMFPVLLCLVQGQDAILLLLLLTLSYRSLKRGNDLLAGVFLALSLFKFQIAVPIAFFFLVRKNWKLLQGFAVTGGFLGLVSMAIVGWRGFLQYFTVVSSVGMARPGTKIDDPALMPNLRGFLLSTVGNFVSSEVVRAIVVVCSIALVGLAVARLRRYKNLEERYAFALAVSVSAVISYHFFPHNACILLLPLLLMGRELISSEQSARWKGLLAFAVLAIYLAPNLLPLNWAMPAVGAASLMFVCLMLSISKVRGARVIAGDAMHESIPELQKGVS